MLKASFSKVEQESISLAVRLEEALADKLKCLIQHRHSFDLYDLVHAIYIDKTIEVNKSEMVQVFLKKTIFERSPGAAKNLLVGVPFDLMKAYWSKLVCPKDNLFAFDDAVSMFSAGLGGLFDSFGIGNASELAFYPADLRNKIMDAGQNQKLLKMTYQGSTREIEPYSLKYHTTKDGTGREYFWGWDRTGGNSRHVGIKAFLNHNGRAWKLLTSRSSHAMQLRFLKQVRYTIILVSEKVAVGLRIY